jgi:lysophospholipase L1-like esterase
MHRPTSLAAITAVALLLPAIAAAESACPAYRPLPIDLPHVRTAIRNNQEILIVALGSSSTAGARASDIGHSYPAMLQDDLAAALPDAHVAVVNRGIGGQDTQQEFDRIGADVLALRPQLVVWQAGANDTLRDLSPIRLRHLLTAGIAQLRAGGADVVLMDNQASPRLLHTQDFGTMESVMATVARDTATPLFGRDALMNAWRVEGYPYADFLAADGLHQNDRGYACVAAMLAQSMLAGLHPAPTLVALKLHTRA